MNDSTTTRVAELPGDAVNAETTGIEVNSYDAIPYSIGAFPQTHPDRLAVIARLFGMPAADPQNCRVLELGCAGGGNLIPMASACPRSQFVGIDLSQRQVADGAAMVRQLELGNIELKHLSILDAGDDLGLFDYILVHGVYSWVPPQVQEKILEICSRNLAANGVAYISYNAYPGWHARGAIREMLWYHTQEFTDPAERIRQARALVAFLTMSASAEDAGYSSLLRQELLLLMNVPDTYLLHEHLEEFNEPLYFHQFAQRAAEKGLQYLGEAQLSGMMPSNFEPKVEQMLRKLSTDLLHMEQYMDFLRNRMFRQTLLCHDHVQLDFALRPAAVPGFRIASAAVPVSEHPDLRSDQPEQFRGANDRILTTSDPIMKSAMAHLETLWPEPVPFDALLDHARAVTTRHSPDDPAQLAARLLNCYASGLVEFSISPPRFTTRVSECPQAAPYVRLRAERGTKVTNMRLEGVGLGEPSRLVLHHLNGQRRREQLVDLVMDWCTQHRPQAAARDRIEQYIDQLLPAFARAALLVG